MKITSLLKKSFFYLIAAELIGIIALVVTYIIHPDISGIIEGASNKIPDQVEEATGTSKVLAYIKNNGLIVPFQMFLLSFIPIPYIYAINIISTQMIVGVLYGAVLRENITEALKLILSSLPHSIIEVFGLCVLAAILYEFNKVILSKVRRLWNKKSASLPFWTTFFKGAKLYVTLVLPLIIIAAFLETYVANFLYRLL